MSEIAKKTRADLFRKRIEDKNTLTGAGAIYVGTGKKTEIEGAGVSGTIGAYYETVGVTPTAVGQVPISVSGTDTAGVAGIEFKSATGIFDGTPTPIRMIATGKGTDGNVRIVSMNNDVMISASHDMTIGVDGDTGTTHLTGKLRLENRENQDITKWPYVEVDSKSVVIKDLASKTSFKPDLVQTTGGTTAPFRLLYQIPEGTWGLDASGAPYQFQSTEPENYLPSIIYNIGQRLDSLGFKELGGDLDSAFEFELKKSYTSESGSTATFALGTLKIAPQDVMGNYCRAVIKFEPEPVFDNSEGKERPMRLKATDYTHASDDNQRRLLFYFDDYFLTRNGEILYDKEASSSITTKLMGKIQNVSVAPNEKVSFYYSFPINLYQNIEDTQPAAYTLVTVYFTLNPYTDDYAGVQMEIHSQNYNGLVTNNKYAVIVPGEADVRTYPIIAYKRKI